MLTFSEKKKELYRTLVGRIMIRDGQVEQVELKVRGEGPNFKEQGGAVKLDVAMNPDRGAISRRLTA